MTDTKPTPNATRAMLALTSIAAMGDSFGAARSSVESFSRMAVTHGPEPSNGPKRRRSKRSTRVAAAKARKGFRW